MTTPWTSNDPHLSGAFAPVFEEVTSDDLQVVEGRIPPELAGTYLRNGPNPQFEPLSYTYPLDGDGMIHAVAFEDGRARYRNRFVRTRCFEIERAAGHAVYGGVMQPVPLDPALLGPGDDPDNPFRQGAFIGVMRHGDHLLALGEVEPAWEMSMELDTLGRWTAGTDRPLELGAHNRRHPVTGDLFALAYDPMNPQVTIHHIGRDGRLRTSFPVALAAPSMIHDFVLTERHLVLLIGPAVFDMAAAAAGGPMLQWRPDLGARIGVVELDGSAPRWFETEAFFVFHFANGFERDGRIVVDYVRHARLNLGYGPGDGAAAAPPRLHRMTLDPASGAITDTALSDAGVEFPRIDDRLVARDNRFTYVPTRTATLRQANPPSATFNCLLQIDGEAGERARCDFGDRIAGEAVFIPRGAAEDDGWLATYLYDAAAGTSDLALLDAARLDAGPVARIRMPQRVPQGLHGTWVPKS